MHYLELIGFAIYGSGQLMVALATQHPAACATFVVVTTLILIGLTSE